jgi:hypothetical protein
MGMRIECTTQRTSFFRFREPVIRFKSCGVLNRHALGMLLEAQELHINCPRSAQDKKRVLFRLRRIRAAPLKVEEMACKGEHAVQASIRSVLGTSTNPVLGSLLAT